MRKHTAIAQSVLLRAGLTLAGVTLAGVCFMAAKPANAGWPYGPDSRYGWSTNKYNNPADWRRTNRPVIKVPGGSVGITV